MTRYGMKIHSMERKNCRRSFDVLQRKPDTTRNAGMWKVYTTRLASG